LEKDLKCKTNGKFDVSKIPDIHDMLKYDMLHNFDIVGKIGRELFDKVSQISGVITPLEYGCD